MKKLLAVSALAVALVLLASCNYYKIWKAKRNIWISTYNNNVCKALRGRVVIYPIFVDDPKYTGVYTAFDIKSTLDSIKKSTTWIESLAGEAGVELNIEIHPHAFKKVYPLPGRLSGKTIAGTAGFTTTGTAGYMPAGIANFDRWADKICKQAFTNLQADTSTIVKTKYKARGRVELIGRLRDIYQTDNIALMFFVKNYYRSDISLALHTGIGETPEYAIVSYKDPVVIAHEFLHLFGAIDLYITPHMKNKKYKKRIEYAQKLFPNEIMMYNERPLVKLEINKLTQYLIGWVPTIDKDLKDNVFGKSVKVYEH